MSQLQQACSIHLNYPVAFRFRKNPWRGNIILIMAGDIPLQTNLKLLPPHGMTSFNGTREPLNAYPEPNYSKESKIYEIKTPEQVTEVISRQDIQALSKDLNRIFESYVDIDENDGFSYELKGFYQPTFYIKEKDGSTINKTEKSLEVVDAILGELYDPEAAKEEFKSFKNFVKRNLKSLEDEFDFKNLQNESQSYYLTAIKNDQLDSIAHTYEVEFFNDTEKKNSLKVMMLNMLTVNPNHTIKGNPFSEKGLGTQMMNELIQRAKDSGVKYIFVGTDTGAEDFYKRFGFTGTPISFQDNQGVELYLKL